MGAEGFNNSSRFSLEKLNSLSSVSAKGMYLLESLKAANDKFDILFILEKSQSLGLEDEDKKQIEKLAELKLEEFSLREGEMSLIDKIYALNVLHKQEDFSVQDFIREFKEIIATEPLDSFENFDRLLYILDSWLDKLPEEDNIGIHRKLAFNLIGLFLNEIEKADNKRKLEEISFQLKKYQALLETHTGKNNVESIDKRINQRKKENGDTI